MKFITQIVGIIRLRSWWNHIVPPVLGAVYFVVLLSNSTVLQSWSFVALWFVSIIGTAVFGFALNDLFDASEDAMAGKSNYLAKTTKPVIGLILVSSFCLAVIPLFFIDISSATMLLFTIQLTCLVVYSTPPFRLKKNIYVSIVLDSLYSGLLFILAIVFSDFPASNPLVFRSILLPLLIAMLFARGLRNILLHQIYDEAFDRKSNTPSMALHLGAEKVQYLIRVFILPFELVLGMSLIGLLSFSIAGIGLLIPVYLLYLALKYFEHKRRSAQIKQTVYLQWHNDFYEDLLPLFFLIMLSINDPWYLIVTGIHVVIFSNKIVFLTLKNLWYMVYGTVYRKAMLWLYYHPVKWLYYKAFCNKYVKNFRNIIIRNHGQ